METLHTSHKIKGLSRKERRLIKKQNVTIPKKQKNKRHIPEPEPVLQSPKPFISKEIMDNIRRILNEFKPRKEYGFVPIRLSSSNHCSYGLTAHHGKPTPQVTEIVHYDYEE